MINTQKKNSVAHTIDLVVIGRHKRTGLSAWLTGATADSILPDIDSDLLVVQLAKID